MVAITNNRDKSLEPRELVEVLYGVKVRVWAPRWRLALAEVVVVVEAEATSEEPLDQSQLGSFLLRVTVGDGWESIERLPSPLVSFMIRWRGRFGVVFVIPVIQECASASLSTSMISGATGIAEFMSTPAGHMVAPLRELNHPPTLLATPPVVILCQAKQGDISSISLLRK